VAVVEARLRYLSGNPENVSYFIGQDSGLGAAAQTVAYITDFAPEWLYDCQVARVSKKKRKVLLIDGAPRIAPTPNK